MFELRCTVRDCQQLLQPSGKTLSCTAGHQFDRAREGYWNLLQPQDRRSKIPGDRDAAVLARHRWLKRGYGAGLVKALRPWTETWKAGESATPATTANIGSQRTLDLGCGEGSFGPALYPGQANGYCGIDLSKRAIKLAVRGWPEATWVVANADRTLPVADASVDQVLSLFGRRPAAEIGRVLVPGGTCIIAVPGEDDLIELREQVQQAGHRRRRWELVKEEMTAAGLEWVEHRTWCERVELEPDAIVDALEMTYRAGRNSRQLRMQSVTAMEVTLTADLILFRGV